MVYFYISCKGKIDLMTFLRGHRGKAEI